MLLSRWTFALATLVTLAGCSGSPDTDAGDVFVPDATDSGRSDGGSDVVVPSTLYQPCTGTEQCMVPGAPASLVCDLTFPGGMCRLQTCTNNFQCGSRGICAGSFGCVPRCAPDQDDCAPFGAVCLSGLPGQSITATGCFASCDVTPPEGVPGCSAPRSCDPYVGECALSPTTFGVVNGEPCRLDSDCRSGRCVPELDNSTTPATPTGFLGGYCLSVGRQIAQSAWDAVVGGDLPRSNCPEGSVILPIADQSAGSPTQCWRACSADGDCRPGYHCDRPMSGSTPLSRNGACRPVDCGAGASCPEGFTCTHPAGSSSAGVCARSSDTPADASTGDASAD
jgi:hypothetical protein